MKTLNMVTALRKTNNKRDYFAVLKEDESDGPFYQMTTDKYGATFHEFDLVLDELVPMEYRGRVYWTMDEAFSEWVVVKMKLPRRGDDA